MIFQFLFLLVILVFSDGSLAAPKSLAAPATSSTKIVLIKVKGKNTCLDLDSKEKTEKDGGETVYPVGLIECDKKDKHQQLEYNPTTLKFENIDTKSCLAVKKDKETVKFRSCDAQGSNKKWVFDKGLIRLKQEANKCLSETLDIEDCDEKEEHQLFELVEVPKAAVASTLKAPMTPAFKKPQVLLLKNKKQNECLDVDKTGKAEKEDKETVYTMGIGACDTKDPNSQLRYDPKTFRLENTGTKTCLSVKKGKETAKFRSCDAPDTHKKWVIENGHVRLNSKIETNKCLTSTFDIEECDEKDDHQIFETVLVGGAAPKTKAPKDAAKAHKKEDKKLDPKKKPKASSPPAAKAPDAKSKTETPPAAKAPDAKPKATAPAAKIAPKDAKAKAPKASPKTPADAKAKAAAPTTPKSAAPAPKAPASVLPDIQVVLLKNKAHNQCADVDVKGVKEKGEQGTVYPINYLKCDVHDELLQLDYDPHTFRFHNIKTETCMAVKKGKDTVKFRSCDLEDARKKWVFEKGHIRLKSKTEANKCLTDMFHIDDCDEKNEHQIFELVPVPRHISHPEPKTAAKAPNSAAPAPKAPASVLPDIQVVLMKNKAHDHCVDVDIHAPKEKDEDNKVYPLNYLKCDVHDELLQLDYDPHTFRFHSLKTETCLAVKKGKDVVKFRPCDAEDSRKKWVFDKGHIRLKSKTDEHKCLTDMFHLDDCDEKNQHQIFELVPVPYHISHPKLPEPKASKAKAKKDTSKHKAKKAPKDTGGSKAKKAPKSPKPPKSKASPASKPNTRTIAIKATPTPVSKPVKTKRKKNKSEAPAATPPPHMDAVNPDKTKTDDHHVDTETHDKSEKDASVSKYTPEIKDATESATASVSDTTPSEPQLNEQEPAPETAKDNIELTQGDGLDQKTSTDSADTTSTSQPEPAKDSQQETASGSGISEDIKAKIDNAEEVTSLCLQLDPNDPAFMKACMSSSK